MSRTVNLGKIVPERGVDYWTETEQNEIISTATTNVENNFAPTIATIQSNSSNALNTANTANNTANTAKSIAEGANQALSYTNYQAMITAFNELADNVYKVGQNIMIITLNVPDLWISAIENTSITYNYTNDEAITTALSTDGYIQVGYYKLSALETQKVDLTDYYTKTGTENKIEDYLYQIMPTDSASGEIATINDSTTMFNAIDVTGTIEPVQDLHGYDNPWSAGGGKNKLDPSTASALGTTVWFCEPNGFLFKGGVSYTFSVRDITDVDSIAIYSTDKSTQLAYATGTSRQSVTYTPTEDTYGLPRLYRATPSITQDIVDGTMIEIGSSRTTYVPYSNICPISGWTGCKVTRTGKNLFLLLTNSRTVNGITITQQTDGGVHISGTATAYINIGLSPMGQAINRITLPKTGANTYCLSGCPSGGSMSTYRIVGYFDNKDNKYVGVAISDVGTGASKAVPEETAQIRLMIQVKSGVTIDEVFYPQFELGSTATPYEPYQSETYDITFPSEAGTVYGGSLDVTTGLLTVDRAINVIDGSQAIASNGIQTYGGLQAQYVPNPPKAYAKSSVTQNSGLLSDRFDTSSAYIDNPYQITGRAINANVYINMPASITTATQARDWFVSNPTQVVYELATPVTYQLTPQEVSFLLGTNNLWVNTGDINVTYKADIQKYIDKKTN